MQGRATYAVSMNEPLTYESALSPCPDDTHALITGQTDIAIGSVSTDGMLNSGTAMAE